MEKNIQSATTSNMTANVPDYAVPTMQTDSATGNKETEWLNTKASQYLGYYKTIPELHSAFNAFATWIVGKGYEPADSETAVVLDHISGWGEDTFNSVIWNLIIQKKVYGDAFAEIIRDKSSGTLLNLKPLDPAKIKIIADDKDIILKYVQINGATGQDKIEIEFDPKDILHLCNDRIADEIHGTSLIQSCEKVILMKNQIMDDWNVVLHRNVVPVRIMEVDTDDLTKVAEITAKYEKAIKNKEIIVIPMGTMKLTSEAGIGNAVLNPLPFMNYLDNFFYQALGVPKIILGGGQEFTEASSKIAYLSYEQVYIREQTEFIADLWNQVGLKIKLNPPASLQNEMLTDNSKDGTNNLQGGAMQPNDMTAGVGA